MKKWLAVLALCGAVLALFSTGGRELPVGGGGVVELPVGDPPLVALTFDDGPRADTTGRLLEGLALREVPATFFLVGERIPGNEALVREMAAAGNQIGVHTYDHVFLTDLKEGEYRDQMARTRGLLTAILGEGDYWLRPPYGILDENVVRWADGPLILWSVDPEDWKDQNRERIVESVVSRAKDGDIILMHDIYQSSVDAALDIVDRLRERGFCFVTVEQMMQLRGVEPEPGGVYRSLPRQQEENLQK